MTAKKRRPISGIVLLDKPVGISSNAALQKVKRLFNARKAGHTGSLDPLASGILPICLGEATKVSAYLLGADKTYRFTCKLGAMTTTGDSEGEVLQEKPVPRLERNQVESILLRFTGQLDQLPPMYSALKHNGKRLYELARQGIEVERQTRRIHVYELRLLTLGETTLECIARCSKGTYIRTLGEDIGAALGCGAYISSLRRTGVANYDSDQMVTLETLQSYAPSGNEAYSSLDSLLLPVDSALVSWPAIHLDDEFVVLLRNGQSVALKQIPESGWLRLYDRNNVFFSIGEVLDDGRVAPRRLIHS